MLLFIIIKFFKFFLVLLIGGEFFFYIIIVFGLVFFGRKFRLKWSLFWEEKNFYRIYLFFWVGVD